VTNTGRKTNRPSYTTTVSDIFASHPFGDRPQNFAAVNPTRANVQFAALENPFLLTVHPPRTPLLMPACKLQYESGVAHSLLQT